jgi:hypothetical protein
MPKLKGVSLSQFVGRIVKSKPAIFSRTEFPYFPANLFAGLGATLLLGCSYVLFLLSMTSIVGVSPRQAGGNQRLKSGLIPTYPNTRMIQRAKHWRHAVNSRLGLSTPASGGGVLRKASPIKVFWNPTIQEYAGLTP